VEIILMYLLIHCGMAFVVIKGGYR